MPSVSWISPPTPRGWARDLVEHARRQHVAAGDAEARRRDLGRRLLDDPVDVDQPLADGASADDAVAARVLGRHFLHRDDRRPARRELLDHLGQHRRRCRSSGRRAGARRRDGRRPDGGRTAPRGRGRAPAAWRTKTHSMSSGLTARTAASSSALFDFSSASSSSKVRSKWSSIARLCRLVTKIISRTPAA